MNFPIRTITLIVALLIAVCGCILIFSPAVSRSPLAAPPRNYWLGGVMIAYAAWRVWRTFGKRDHS
ncbi:MAG: hypothetical protein JNM00_14710 [Flavobacteriales bacterium]|nr:hypothetical protein [Flavobacteriales bacterium]